MKQTIYYFIIIICVAVLAGMGFLLAAKRATETADEVAQAGLAVGRARADLLNDSADAARLATLIRVTNPSSNELIDSPLTVTGEARGTWFFEASFPVKLLDSNNNVIAQGVAQADGEWMTTEFVPFTATLSYSDRPSGTGTLILQKDNPSGEPANDDQLEVPVRF